jgi:hypothetical protein
VGLDGDDEPVRGASPRGARRARGRRRWGGRGRGEDAPAVEELVPFLDRAIRNALVVEVYAREVDSNRPRIAGHALESWRRRHDRHGPVKVSFRPV